MPEPSVRSAESNELVAFVRENYPDYDSLSDEELRQKLAAKPEGLVRAIRAKYADSYAHLDEEQLTTRVVAKLTGERPKKKFFGEPVQPVKAILRGTMTGPQAQKTLSETYGQFPADVASVVGEVAESLATPENALLGFAIGKAGPAIRGAASGAFGGAALAAAYQQYPALKKAVEEERWGDAAKEALRLGLYSGFALFMGKHAKAQTKLYSPPKEVVGKKPPPGYRPPPAEQIAQAEDALAKAGPAPPSVKPPSPEVAARAAAVSAARQKARVEVIHRETVGVTEKIRKLEEVRKSHELAGNEAGISDVDRRLRLLREEHGDLQRRKADAERVMGALGRDATIPPGAAPRPVVAPNVGTPAPGADVLGATAPPKAKRPPAEAAPPPAAESPVAAPRAAQQAPPRGEETYGISDKPMWHYVDEAKANERASLTRAERQLSADEQMNLIEERTLQNSDVYADEFKLDPKMFRRALEGQEDFVYGITTTPKKPGDIITVDDLTPEVQDSITIKSNLTALSDLLGSMRKEVGRSRTESGEWRGVKSPLPKSLQRKWRYDDIRTLIAKGLRGEKLTPGQQEYWDDLVSWAKKEGGEINAGDVHDLIRERKLPFKSELDAEEAAVVEIRTGEKPIAPGEAVDTSFNFGELADVELKQPGAPESPLQGPPFAVKTPAGDVVKPNPPADPSLRALADEQLERLAGSTDDQKIAQALAKIMGVERPVVVTRGDVPVAQTTSANGLHQIVLPRETGSSVIYHEMRHVAANEGKAPPVTEGAKDLELGEFLAAQETAKKAAGLPPPPQPPPPGAPPPGPGELPKYAASINLNRVNSVAEIKQQILKDAEALPAHKDLTLQEASRQAIDAEMTIADEVKFSKKYKGLHVQVLSARNAALAAYERFAQAAAAVKQGETPETLEAMRVAFHNRIAAVQAWNDIAHEAGLTLSLFRVQVEPFAARAKMSKAVDKLLAIVAEKGKLSDEIVRRAGLLNWESPREVQTFLQHLSPLVSSRPERVFEWYINSLLSGPKTHEANLLGNTGSGLVLRPLTEAVAGAGEQIRAGLRGEAPEAFAAQAVYRLKGAFSSLRDAVTVFLRTMGTGVSESGLSKFEETTSFRGPAIEGRLRVGGGEPMGPDLGRVVRTPGTFLKAADDFFRVIGERAGKYSYHYREGRKAGLKGPELDKYVLEEANKPHPEIDARAIAETTEDVYQSPLGKAWSDLLRLRDDSWFGRFVAPFLRIGINLPKYQLGYTGPANLFKLWYQARKGKLPGGPELNYELAKAAIGSAIAMYVVNETASGNLTGGGPADYRQRREWENAGNLPYSKRREDGSSVSYARSPVGIIVGVMADLAEILNLVGEAKGRGDLDAKQAETLKDAVIGKTVAAVANNITNQTFLKGVSDLFEMGKDPERGGPRIAGQFVGALASPTLVSNIATAMDPFVREARTFSDEIKKRIPVARQTLPVMRDIRGRAVEAAGTPLSRMFNLFVTREPRGGKIQKKIVDLGLGWDRLDRVMTVRNNRVELTNEEYDDFNETSGRHVDYFLRALEPDERWSIFSRLPTERQAEQIKEMVETGRRDGRQEFIARHIGEWMRQGRVR